MAAHTATIQLALYGVSNDDSGLHGPGIAHIDLRGGDETGWAVDVDNNPDRAPTTTHYDELPASLAWLLGLLGLTPTDGGENG